MKKLIVLFVLAGVCSLGLAKESKEYIPISYSFGNRYCIDWNRDIENGRLIPGKTATLLSAWVHGYITANSGSFRATTIKEIDEMVTKYCKEYPTLFIKDIAVRVRGQLYLSSKN